MARRLCPRKKSATQAKPIDQDVKAELNKLNKLFNTVMKGD